MIIEKKWGFGFGTIFSLIVVYFIYLYSKSQEWALLAFISKWYLIIVGGLIALSLGIILIVILFSLLMILLAMLKINMLKSNLNKKHKTRENQRFSWPRKSKGFSRETENYIDAEYKVKE